MTARAPSHRSITMNVSPGYNESAIVKEGRSGVMDLLTVRTDATDADGAPVFVARSTAAIRR